MRPYDKKYYYCEYCHGNNTHRIYVRAKNEGRKFISIAWYCTKCKLFSLDDVRHNSHERKYRLEHKMKPEDNYLEWLNRDKQALRRMLG